MGVNLDDHEQVRQSVQSLNDLRTINSSNTFQPPIELRSIFGILDWEWGRRKAQA
jgi:hypothetical protein